MAIRQGRVECAGQLPDEFRVVKVKIDEAGRGDLDASDCWMGREMIRQGLSHLQGGTSETFAEPK